MKQEKNIFLKERRIFHLIGIGGIGMSGIASLLQECGHKVRGSDIKHNSNISRLKNKGVEVFIGHSEKNIYSDVEGVIYSSAVTADNPELVYARKKGIPIISRGEALGFISQDKKVIAVAGSHGKTTVSSLLAYTFKHLKKPCGFCIGGVPLELEENASWDGNYFVVETDESDGSFLFLRPYFSIITNIDREHLDYYCSFENLKKAFDEFAKNTRENIFIWADDTLMRDFIRRHTNKVISFGLKRDNEVFADNIVSTAGGSIFNLHLGEKIIKKVKISLLGRHNIINALAVFAFFYYRGENIDKVAEAIGNFKGTKRRLETKESLKGITFIDDYAHHPAEIKATLNSVRLLKPKRLVVVFQPHRFSRLKLLWDEFISSFSQVDILFITDVYPAGEPALRGVNSQKFYLALKELFKGYVRYLPKEQLLDSLYFFIKEGDLVLSLGAGDLNCIIDELRERIRKN